MNFSVTIGGVDCSGHVTSIHRDHSLCKRKAQAEIQLDPTWAQAFNPYNLVEISEKGTSVFKGYTVPVQKQRMEPLYIVTAQDFTKKIADTWLLSWETSGSVTPNEAIVDLMSLSGIGPTQYSLNDTTDETLPEKEWEYVSAMEVLVEILTMVGWQIYSDGNGILQIGEIRFGTSSHTFQEGVNLVNVTRQRDDSYTRNAIAVYGSKGINVKKTLVEPAMNDMERAGAFANSLIHTQACAEEVATRALQEFNRLLDVKTCTILGDPTVMVSDVATIIESFTGLHHECLVTSLRAGMDANGYLMEVVLDERCPVIWGHDSRPRLLYAATAGSGVCRSDTYGDEWYAINGSGGSALTGSRLNVNAIEADCRDPLVVWAATDGGLFRTQNGGIETWEYMQPELSRLSGAPVTSGSQVYYAVDQDEVHPDRVYFLCADGGLQESWVGKYSGGSWANWPVRWYE